MEEPADEPVEEPAVEVAPHAEQPANEPAPHAEQPAVQPAPPVEEPAVHEEPALPAEEPAEEPAPPVEEPAEEPAPPVEEPVLDLMAMEEPSSRSRKRGRDYSQLTPELYAQGWRMAGWRRHVVPAIDTPKNPPKAVTPEPPSPAA